MSTDSPSPVPRPAPGSASGPARDAFPLPAAVDAEIARLDGQDVSEQVETYHRLHSRLTDALTRTTDAGPPRPGP